jgi:hypothetical protein
MMFFQSEIVEISFRVGDYDQIHLFALLPIGTLRLTQPPLQITFVLGMG